MDQSPFVKRRLAALKIAAGALLVLVTCIGLAIAGLTAIGKSGYLTWIGWTNLTAVFVSSLALAWVLRSRSTGLGLPQNPPPHLLGEDQELWKKLRDWTRQIQPEKLADNAERLKKLQELEELLYPPNSIPGSPHWRDLTLVECAAAIRLTQARLDSDARRMAGPILDIPLGDWKQGWEALKWYWRLAPLAWLPGILLAPWEALARWTITRVGPEQINQTITSKLRDDISRHMLMKAGESLIELRGRRLRAGAEVWLESHPRAPETTKVQRGGFPWLSLFIAGVLAVLPWVAICGLGAWYLATQHPVWLLFALSFLVGGSALAGFHFQHFWPFSPPTGGNAVPEKLAAGNQAGENWVQERVAAGSLPLADANAWLDSLLELDQTIRKAEGHTETVGWDHLTPREILSWAKEQARGLDLVLRERIPGSLHLRLGDWMKAADWAGITGTNPNLAPPEKEADPQPAPGVFGGWWQGIKNRFEGVVVGIKKKVENLASVTLAKFASEGLASLHAHAFRSIPEEANGEFQNSSEKEKPPLKIAVVGTSNGSITTLVSQLSHSAPLRIEKLDWSQIPLSPAPESPSESVRREAQTAAMEAGKADLILYLWRTGTDGGVREAEFFGEIDHLTRKNHSAINPKVETWIILTEIDQIPNPPNLPGSKASSGSPYPEENLANHIFEAVEKQIQQICGKSARIPGFRVIPVSLTPGSYWPPDRDLANAIAEKAQKSRLQAWNQWISTVGKPGWRQLARQAKDAGKWLWKRI